MSIVKYKLEPMKDDRNNVYYANWMIRTGAKLFANNKLAKKLVKSYMATLSNIGDDLSLFIYLLSFGTTFPPMAIRSFLYEK